MESRTACTLIRASLGILMVGIPNRATASANSKNDRAISQLTADKLAHQQDGAVHMNKTTAQCYASILVEKLGISKALFLTDDPQRTDHVARLTAKDRAVYFDALTTCVRDLDVQVATFLTSIRNDLTQRQATCVAVAYSKNGGLKYATLSDSSDASFLKIDTFLASASKACTVSPAITAE